MKTLSVNTTMSSREIAELTGKRHDHVCRDIRNILQQLGIGEPKFGASYTTAQGKQAIEYLLPKRETLILTSGYSITQRTAIIDRWLELEESVGPKTPTEMLVVYAQRLVEQERRQAAIEAEQARQAAELVTLTEEVRAKSDYVAIMGACTLAGKKVNNSTAAKLGKIASKYCRTHMIPIHQVNHEIFGLVNTYRRDVANDVVKMAISKGWI